MHEMFCQNCGGPLEQVKLNSYKKSSPKVTRHVGENYLLSQRVSGLEPEDREQLRNWAHPIVAVDGEGRPFSANFKAADKLGRQFD